MILIRLVVVYVKTAAISVIACPIFVELLCTITMRELLQKASMDKHTKSESGTPQGGIEQLAAQFNRVGSSMIIN